MYGTHTVRSGCPCETEAVILVRELSLKASDVREDGRRRYVSLGEFEMLLEFKYK